MRSYDASLAAAEIDDADWRRKLAELLNDLPGPGGDVECQARAILRYVLRPADTPGVPIGLEVRTCPNCGRVEPSVRTPYCSEHCKEAAGFVRQFRAGLSSGWIFEAEKQVALGQNLWDLMGGGRPLRVSIAPMRSVKAVMQRDGGRCRVCGGPAATIDHAGSGCNRPINLRAVCEACSVDRPFGDPAVLARPETVALVQDLTRRVQAPVPLRCCDDARTWDWREFVARRNA